MRPRTSPFLIDTDLLVTRPSTELIASGGGGTGGGIPKRKRSLLPRLGDLPGLGAARPRPYVSSSLVFLGGATGSNVLSLMDGLRSGVDFGRTFWRANDADYPFLLGDQDLLNAILATEIDPALVTELDPRLKPFRRSKG